MEPRQEKEEIEIDLREILGVMLTKWWLIALLGIITALGALIFSKFVLAPVYSSSTQVYVLSRQNEQSNVTFSDLQTGTQLTKDYLELVKSKTVLSQVITRLNLDMEESQLSRMILVETPEDTRIIKITVNSTDAYQAQKVANDVREVASEHICNVMNLEAVNVIDVADVPTHASSPNVTKNTMLGLLIGFVIGVGIVFVGYVMDDSIKSPDDVEKYLSVSVLASIPILEEDKNRRRHEPAFELNVNPNSALEDEIYSTDTEGDEDWEDDEK